MNRSHIVKYIAGFVNLLFLSLIGITLFLLTIPFQFEKRTFEPDAPHTYYAFIIFCVLISAAYALIFVVFLYNKKVSKLWKAIITGVTGTIVIYVFSLIGGGGLSTNRPSDVLVLAIVFILGFILPFSLRKIYKALTSHSHLVLLSVFFLLSVSVQAQNNCLPDTVLKTSSVGTEQQSFLFAAKFVVTNDSIILVDNLSENGHMVFKVLKQDCNWDASLRQGENIYDVLLSSWNKKVTIKIHHYLKHPSGLYIL